MKKHKIDRQKRRIDGLHDLTLKKVAENKNCATQQNMTHFLSLDLFISKYI